MLLYFVTLISTFAHLSTSAITGNATSRRSDCARQCLLETDLLKKLDSYDKNYLPLPTEDLGPVETKLNIYVYSINSINVRNMDYQLELLIRQQWKEPRLELSNLKPDERLILTHDETKLWQPDLFFRNAKSGFLHSLTVPNNFIWLRPNGVIEQSQKVSLKLSCQMDLHDFPFDEQICYVDMGSYSYLKEDLDFIWWDGNSSSHSRHNSSLNVELNTDLPQNDLVNITTTYCNQTLSLTGSFACLKVAFIFKRQIGYYLIYYFLKSTLLVSVAWMSFLIDPMAVPARVAVGTIGVLTLVTQSAAVNSLLPSVSYVKAIDIWFATCLLFAIIALVEFCLVNTIIRRAAGLDRIDKVNEEERRRDSDGQILALKLREYALAIDSFMFIIFPLAFVIFTACYWIYYTGFDI